MAEFVAAPEPAALSTEKDSSILGEAHADPSSPDSVIPAFHEERENAEYASEEAEAEDVDDGSPSSPDVEPESPGPQPGAPSEDDALYGEEEYCTPDSHSPRFARGASIGNGNRNGAGTALLIGQVILTRHKPVEVERGTWKWRPWSLEPGELAWRGSFRAHE